MAASTRHRTTTRLRAATRLAQAVRTSSAPGSPSLATRLMAVPRLIRAVRDGSYTGVSSGQLALLLAGVGYIVSPVDLVPEGLLLVLGLADDVLVLGWVVSTLVKETEDFLAWEASAAASASAVPSHVVR